MDTHLVISGMWFSPYAARELTPTLAPIEQAKQLRRTASGTLVDVSVEQFRKYRSRISCTDQRVPAIDGIWPGMVMTVSCIAELSHPIGGTPSRPAASPAAWRCRRWRLSRPWRPAASRPPRPRVGQLSSTSETRVSHFGRMTARRPIAW